jgi:methyltransferase family protein
MSRPAPSIRHFADIESFRGLWPGGYHEGYPLDPGSESTYGPLGYMSVLHVTYLLCVRPYIRPETVAVEIGPGRGAWTRTLLGAQEVWCLDVLSEEETGFADYLGKPRNVHYLQVSDFECRDLPDDHFDYLFSFGCLCHIPFDGVSAYMRNLHPKLRKGAQGFIMVADFAKYRAALREIDRLDAVRRGMQARLARRWYLRLLSRWLARPRLIAEPTELREDSTPSPGRWYDAGTARTCSMLEACGYRVLDPDVQVSLRDPVIHFTK